MRRMMIVVVALAAIAWAPAWAQSDEIVDPIRMQLAKQVFELSGGRRGLEANLRAVNAGVEKMWTQALPDKMSAMIGPMAKTLQDETLAQVPQLIDIAEKIYAQNYSEQELRDYIAWLKTDSAQSIIAKGPVVNQKAMAATQPLFVNMLPKMFADIFDKVCAQQHCSADQRKQLDALIASMAKR